MAETLYGTDHYRIHQLSGEVNHRDFLMLAGIYKMAHPERGNLPLTDLRQTIDEYADSGIYHNALFVARNQPKNRVLGAAMVYLSDVDTQYGLHIDELFVEIRSRGRGIGRQLLRTCIEFGQDAQAAYIQLDHKPDEAGSRLFQSMVFTENDQDRLRLKLD